MKWATSKAVRLVKMALKRLLVLKKLINSLLKADGLV
jgi:hypothetical protein